MALDPALDPPNPDTDRDDTGRDARDGAVALADLPPGSLALVTRVDTTPIGRRLLDLGFVPGTAIRVLRRAPLGDPTTYELRGTRMCLRRAEALAVRVRVRLRVDPTEGP